MSSSQEERIRSFYVDWCQASPQALARYFTDRARFEPVSRAQPILGATAIAGTIEIFRGRFDEVEIHVLHMASADNVVHCEHRWDYAVGGGRRFSVSAHDAFTFEGDRISIWRSYFDPTTLTSQIDLGEG
ncbi:MAG: nuclear transport factor 2 family protein [Deltaproteobacteria bacterium]